MNGAETLTIGMATRGEFDSVYFTLSALAANHPKVSYLVVDNTPERCPRTEAITRSVGGRYVHRPDLTGTSKPRDAVFRFARTPWVMCVDSHVVFESFSKPPSFLAESSIATLLAWIADNPNSRDLIQGPMISDDGIGCSTHWNRPKPPGLWGEWLQSRLSNDLDRPFTFHVEGDAVVRREVMTGAEIDRRAAAGFDADKAGWRRVGPYDAPFEIPMLGLGCWAMRRDYWPGFNPAFQGFGGEEGYLHEIVRKHGGKCLLLPSLRWRHKFRDVGGWDRNPTPYPLRLEDHTWNLLIGHRELGIPAEEAIYEHFGKRIPPPAWAKLVDTAATVQPYGGPRYRVAPQSILAVWYTDNTAPPDLLRRSLGTIMDAAAQTWRHRVKVVTVGWEPIPGNPFPFVQYSGERKRSHAALVRQILQGMEAVPPGAQMDAVACLEHDVLYPAHHFDRIGDALAHNPLAPVVSNTDYIGLNATGWLAVKERHEPMHQLAVRWGPMVANLHRAAAECERGGGTIVEPDHGKPRADWVRLAPFAGMPAVHVNHTGTNGAGRFTSHGEVCYAEDSGGAVYHPYWGEAKHWWPGEMVKAKTVAPAPKPGCASCSGDGYGTLEEWYTAVGVKPSDFHEHVKTLKELADGCDHVAELSTWGKPALIALCASTAKRVTSYAPRPKAEWKVLDTLCESGRFRGAMALPVQVEPCDLLFIDTDHTAATVYAQLSANAAVVSRYIVVHTTAIYGETGDDGGPGVLPAVRRFLTERPEWTTVRHDPNNFGLLVLSRDDRDKTQPPGALRKALNFSKALVKHVGDGRRMVPDDVFNARVELCVMCPDRFHDTCGACGCPIQDKAAWASEDCGRVKLGDPKKPPLWGRYTDPGDAGVNLTSVDGGPQMVTVGYDFDGVLSTGKIRPSAPFVVVSGRPASERHVITRELDRLGLKPVAVYTRTTHDIRPAWMFKSDVVSKLGLVEFHDDNNTHLNAIREKNPACRLVLVGK